MLAVAVTAAFADAERVGWAWCPAALAPADAERLAAEVADVPLVPLVPTVGTVQQSGATGVAAVQGRPLLTALAAEIGGATNGWEPDEVAVGRYGPGGGISPHRDNSFYTDWVLILTVSGEARFRVLADRAATDVLCDVTAGPGDLAVLRGPRDGDVDARPFHDVGPPADGKRTVLVLRRNARGAGRGWT